MKRFLLLVLLACGSAADSGTGGGGGGGSSATGGGSAAGGGTASMTKASFGQSCSVGSDCQSGTCSRPAPFDASMNFCTQDCSSTNACPGAYVCRYPAGATIGLCGRP